MPENSLTLNTLLGLPDKDFSDQVINASSDQGEETEPAQDRVSKGLHGLQWKFVEGEIRRKAGELLDVDVMEMMVSAWRGSKLIEHLQQESKDNDGPAHVPLLKHNIHSELEPAIEIQLGQFKKTIPFQVEVDFTLDGLILKIEDRIIHAIEAGSLEGEGKIKIGRIPLPKRSFGPLDLPGKINLKKGIPLA
ncbi:MAG: hypothetical protein DMG65_18215 [Candidatus Angelobacter sp. Gp1-AA117]|nr:MAG: hypothetical protein DMG65_18215 [Candidatus Angelobacter sp. Gp1-AA117]